MPRRLTPEIEGAIYAFLAAGMSRTETARATGVAYETVQKRAAKRNKHPLSHRCAGCGAKIVTPECLACHDERDKEIRRITRKSDCIVY
jgi:cytochrome c5